MCDNKSLDDYIEKVKNANIDSNNNTSYIGSEDDRGFGTVPLNEGFVTKTINFNLEDEE